MQLFLVILIFLQFLWMGYLTYIVYHSRRKQVSNQPPSHLKISLTRFNPFNDLGGDQSFILVLLDDHHDGVIVTSLHSRDRTRVYAKPLSNGNGQNVSLSRDEKLAILKAIKG